MDIQRKIAETRWLVDRARGLRPKHESALPFDAVSGSDSFREMPEHRRPATSREMRLVVELVSPDLDAELDALLSELNEGE